MVCYLQNYCNVNINEKDEDENTALIIASMYGYLDIVKILFQ